MKTRFSYSIAEMVLRLLRIAKPVKGPLALATAASIVGNLAHMGLMGFGAMLLLSCAGWTDAGSPGLFAALMVASGALIVLGRYVEGVSSHAGAYRLLASMRIHLFESIRRLAPACLMDRKKGDLLNIAVSDIETVEFFFAHTIGPLFTVVLLPVTTLVLLFFLFSIIGWCWEVVLHLLSEGTFVNRGVLHGPWLPIYGTGGVLVLLTLYKLRDKPWLEFWATVVVCGVAEYFTAYYLETVYDRRWWDYAGYFLNLHGRICAEGLLVFGLGGMAVVYGVAPLFDNLLHKVRRSVLIGLCAALIALFCVDQAYSHFHPNEGEGITDEVVYKTDDARIRLDEEAFV